MSRKIDPTQNHRAQIRSEVDLITPFDERERHSKCDALQWIDSGAELYRRQKPATPPKHLIAYSVLVDGDHILLVDHRNAELWLPPGGHVDPGEHPRSTARRELREELGIDYESDIGAPTMISLTSTVGRTAGHVDVSLWYLLRCARSTPFVCDQTEFSAVRWFHKDNIPFARSDARMRQFIQKLYSANGSGPDAGRH